jgi:hypothetical protein
MNPGFPLLFSQNVSLFGKFRGLLDDEEEPTGLDGETSDGFQSLSDDDDIDSDNDIDTGNDVDGDDDEFDEEGFGEDSEEEEIVFNKKPAPSQPTKKGGEMKSPKEKKKNKKKKDTMEDEMDFAEMEAAATKSKKKKFPKANTHPVNILTQIVRGITVLRIRCLFDPWIWDPEQFFPDPGSQTHILIA